MTEPQPQVKAADAPASEPRLEALHAVEGYCARLPDGRLCLMFGDADHTRYFGVTLADDEMVSELHTALAMRLRRPASATLH